MSTLRNALVMGAVVAGGTALVACTLTRSLDYLTEGPDGPGTSSSSGASTSSGSSSSNSSNGGLVTPEGTVLASGQEGPNHLAQDGSSIYWTTETKKLMKVPKAGGAAVELATLGAAGDGLCVDPTDSGNVFVTVAGAVKLVPKAGGAVTDFPLGTAEPVKAIACDETFVFVVLYAEAEETATLARYPKAPGGAGARLAPATTLGPAILLFGNDVFWTTDTAEVHELPKSVAAPTPPATAAGIQIHANTKLDEDGEQVGIYPTSVKQIAIDGERLYWIENLYEPPVAVKLERTPLAGQARTVLEAVGDAVPNGIAVGAESIYLTTRASKMFRIAKSGNPPAPVEIAAPPNVKAMIVDGDALFVSFSGTGGPTGGVQKIPVR